MRQKIGLLLLIILAAEYDSQVLAEKNLTFPVFREVTVTFLVDKDLFKTGASESRMWDELNQILTFMTRQFEKDFGITFIFRGVEEWEFPAGGVDLNADSALTEAETQALENFSDITIGLTRKPLSRYEYDGKKWEYNWKSGMARPLGIAMVVVLDSAGKLTAVHELGHIFRADHSSDPRSFMHEHVKNPYRFDRESLGVIRKNREREFLKIISPY